MLLFVEYRLVVPACFAFGVLCRSLELSPSESHIFKTGSQELGLVKTRAAISQQTATVPAKAPSAARPSHSFTHPALREASEYVVLLFVEYNLVVLTCFALRV